MESRASKTAQQVRLQALTVQAWRPESDPQNLCGGRRTVVLSSEIQLYDLTEALNLTTVVDTLMHQHFFPPCPIITVKVHLESTGEPFGLECQRTRG